LFLAMAVNSRPRKITSSKNPTQSIQTTRQTVFPDKDKKNNA